MNFIPAIFGVLFNLKYGMLFLCGINFYFIFNKQHNLLNHIQIFVCLLISFIGENSFFPFFFLLFIIIFYLFVYGKLFWIRIHLLTYLGKISYSLYLLHQFIGYSIQYSMLEYGVKNTYFIIITPLIVSLFFAIITTEFFEKPILKWANWNYKNKWSNYFVKNVV